MLVSAHIGGMRFTTLTPAQDRAIHELCMGRSITLTFPHDAPLLCSAIDTLPAPTLIAGGYALLSGPRALMLGLSDGSHPVAVRVDPDEGAEQLAFLMQSSTKIGAPLVPIPDFADTVLNLAIQGRLPPALYLRPFGIDAKTQEPSDPDALTFAISDLHLGEAPTPLRHLSTVPLPLNLHGQRLETQALMYDQAGATEALLALTLGDPHSQDAPLVRLHSACLTGDVFGSLRCDCGPQLHRALHAMADAGHGCLLYLPQEGRDTGLRNKLRAYALQDAGLDTIDADATLGFSADERDFAMAAALLRHMGLERVSLMTNNPAKVAGLEAKGIKVERRIPLQIKAQTHNQAYLKTKAQRAGHDL